MMNGVIYRDTFLVALSRSKRYHSRGEFWSRSSSLCQGSVVSKLITAREKSLD